MNDVPQMTVSFTITNYGEAHSYNAVIDTCTPWHEVLDQVVRALEASYGYTFDLDELGIYYRGKEDD